MITVLDTGLANASSVIYALDRIGVKSHLSRDPDFVTKSSRVIIPGVGTANALMCLLNSSELGETIKKLKQPVLGICLGMQAFYEFSDEGGVKCLGLLKGRVTRLQPEGNLPIPHMGWNRVVGVASSSLSQSILFKGIAADSHFYFVHSYRAPSANETVALTNHGETIPAAIEFQNWFGTQFHPERSGEVGERVLRNFLKA